MKIIDDDDNYDDNGSESSAVLSASVSIGCGASSGCNVEGGHQIWRVAGIILNKEQRTSDKGCPPVWWLGELLPTEQLTARSDTERFTKLRTGTVRLERCKGWELDRGLGGGRDEAGMGLGHG
jgi:hypothetical protein